MVLQEFQDWLDCYGKAWVSGDPDAVIDLFSADASYYERPFDPPMKGAAAIHRYWTEGAKNSQTNVTFLATPITLEANMGFARWQATYRRVPSGSYVELDGILSASFDGQMLCTEFREWWHRRET